MLYGRFLVLSGSAIGSLILTGLLTFLSSLMTIHPPAVQAALASTASAQINQTAPGPQPEQFPLSTNCQLSARFPEDIYRWCGLITQYSIQNGLSPDLIAALIWQESSGDPNAYSKSGAVGLMQIMPRDGIAASFQCINGPCFSNRPSIAELYDPEFNILFGTRMLSQLLLRSGDLRDALRSYGPMDVGYSYADKVLTIYQTYRQE